MSLTILSSIRMAKGQEPPGTGTIRFDITAFGRNWDLYAGDVTIQVYVGGNTLESWQKIAEAPLDNNGRVTLNISDKYLSRNLSVIVGSWRKDQTGGNASRSQSVTPTSSSILLNFDFAN